MARIELVIEVVLVIFLKYIAATSLQELHFGTVVLSSTCSSLDVKDLENDYNELHNLSNSEISITLKALCLDSENIISMGHVFCAFLEKESIANFILTKSCYPQCELLAAITSQLGIPTLQTDPYLFRSSLQPENPPFNLYPEKDIIDAIESLLILEEIDNVVVLYDSFTGSDLAVDLLQKNIQVTPIEVTLNIDSLISYNNESIKEILIEIRESSHRNIIIHTPSLAIPQIMEMALFLGILNNEWLWILTNLEVVHQNLEFLKISDVSLIAIAFQEAEYETLTPLASYPEMMIGDASLIMTEALLNLKDNHNITLATKYDFKCSNGSEWSYGIEAQKEMEEISIIGKTGQILFTERQRSNSTFKILNLENEVFQTVGIFSKKNGLELISDSEQEDIIYPLRAVTILNAPYMQLKDDYEKRTGNDRFSGLLIDMMDLISPILGIEYELYVVPDGYFGGITDNGTWNGVVGELVKNNADIAIASLTITSIRSEVVDFTNPYQTTGRNFVMRKPDSHPSGFVFLDPLSWEVWMSLILSFISVSILLIITSFISPYEDRFLSKDNTNNKSTKFQKKLLDSLWYIYACLLQQGTEFSPRSLSSRVLSGSWWLFAFIMLSMYTANMTAFLTVERLQGTIESVDDLIDHEGIYYGLMKSGSTEEYLKGSTIEPYKTLWKNVEKNPSWLVENLVEGMQRTCNESYVFFTESATNIYYSNTYTDCDLTIIGNPIGEIGYGFAFQSGSLLREQYSTLILTMQEEGTIDEMMKKWNLVYEESTDEPASGNVLEMSNLVGVFYILAGGCSLGFLLSITELFWHQVKKTAYKQKRVPESYNSNDKGLFYMTSSNEIYGHTNNVESSSMNSE